MNFSSGGKWITGMPLECFVRAGTQHCRHCAKCDVGSCKDCDSCAGVDPSARVWG